jgi:hypothetical protein
MLTRAGLAKVATRYIKENRILWVDETEVEGPRRKIARRALGKTQSSIYLREVLGLKYGKGKRKRV